MANIKRIRKPILENEYTTLMNYIKHNEKMRDNTKGNFLRLFSLLYYTGMRISEVLPLKIGDVQEAIQKGTLIVEVSKQHKEREIYLTPKAIKELKKYFLNGSPEHKVIQPRGNPTNSVSTKGYTIVVNRTIKEILGDRYSSHSFRSGIITKLALSQISAKIVQNFIGHKNIQTTLNYIKPTESDIRNAISGII